MHPIWESNIHPPDSFVIPMKHLTFLAALCMLAFGQSARCDDSQKIAYPTADAPSFVIEAPDSWKLEPAEEDGDFFQLEGPTARCSRSARSKVRRIRSMTRSTRA